MSRARAIAATTPDPEETVQELMAYAWWNHQQSARKGRWLSAGQLAWVGMKRIRVGAVLGSSRTASDVMAPACQRQGRARIIHLSTMDGRGVDDPIRQQFDQVIGQGLRSIPAEVAARIDWASLRAVRPDRQRRVLDHLAIGRTPSEIAKRLRVSPSRVTQIKNQLAESVMSFFGQTWASA
jgi:hypothetical protein